MTIRKAFFWLHLSAGCVAGVVILVMCVTGVMLAWERQIVPWVDRGFRHAPADAQTKRVSPEALLAAASKAKGGVPTALTLHSDRNEPASAEFGRETVLYLNPWTGEVLGEGSQTARAFFRETENWHRWLASGLQRRTAARGITGASNLVFLGLLLSGFYLWLPKKWTWQHVRPALWFRGGVSGKARDWNWHNVIGIWCVLPLFVVVACGVVMSYPWANALVYRLTGSEMPAQGGGPVRTGNVGRRTAQLSLVGLDVLWQKAESQMPDWKTISMRLPASSSAPVSFQIDLGNGGRPDLRGQLTLDRTSSKLLRWEPFKANNAGRRLRSWIRFAHTGEAGGIAGETVAALASLGGAFLVYTGISLAIRRLLRAVG